MGISQDSQVTLLNEEVAAWGESTVWYIWTFGVISAFDLPYFPTVIPLLIEYAHTYSLL